MSSIAPIAKVWAAFGRHVRLAMLAVVVIAAAVWLGPRWVQGPLVPVSTVVQAEFVQRVVASGRVESDHRMSLGAQLTGTVAQVFATEGQSVVAASVLVALDPTELRANLTQAELAVQQAAARLRQLREVQAPVAEQVATQARANHAAARQVLARSRDLLAQGFVGQAALDEAIRAEQVAAAQVRSSQQQLAAAMPAGSDTALAEATLAQARAGAEVARARLRQASITAPVAGQVIRRQVEPGDVVQPGKVLMVLSPQAPGGDTRLLVQIDEKNLHLLRTGQSAVASADAYAGQQFAATVAAIDPAVDPQRGAVEVKLRVVSPPAYLRQDMTVSVDIEVARRAAAVLVPAEVLRDADGDSPWVLVLVEGHARRRPLKLGLRGNGQAEVLEGLRAGDQVLPASGPAVAAVADGDRVRALSRSAR